MFRLGRMSVSAEEIVAFGREWDPQRMHTDPDWAASYGPFGGLIASGVQVMGVWMRLMVPGVFADTAVIAGRSLEHIRLHRPLRPGMEVEARAEVVGVELRDNGRARVRFLGTLHHEDELLFEHVNETVVRRRGG